MMKNIFCLLLVISLFACVEDQKTTDNTTSETTKTTNPPVKTSETTQTTTTPAPAESNVVIQDLKADLSHLPNPCGFLTVNDIGKAIGVDAAGITIKDATTAKSPNSRACFYRWDHEGVPNSGLLVNISDNPIPDEFPEWASYYINSKINQGDKMGDGSVTYRYKRWDMGKSGAYNYDLARYVWRTEDNLVYAIFFNLAVSEAEQLLWAEKLAKIILAKHKTS